MSIAIVCAGLLLLAAQHESEQAVVAELTRLETVWNQAHINADADALDRLWADDIVVMVQSMPIMSKKDALGMTRTGRMKFDRYETSDTQFRVYGEAAVVTGRVKRARRMGERSAQDDWLFTKTYVRRNGRWQVVSWHASDAPR